MCNNIRNPSWASARSSMVRFPDAFVRGRNFETTWTFRDRENRFLIHGTFRKWSTRMIRTRTMDCLPWLRLGVKSLSTISTLDLQPLTRRTIRLICCVNSDDPNAAPPHPACYQFNVPTTDTFYGMFNRTCINFVRYTPVASTRLSTWSSRTHEHRLGIHWRFSGVRIFRSWFKQSSRSKGWPTQVARFQTRAQRKCCHCKPNDLTSFVSVLTGLRICSVLNPVTLEATSSCLWFWCTLF